MSLPSIRALYLKRPLLFPSFLVPKSWKELKKKIKEISGVDKSGGLGAKWVSLRPINEVENEIVKSDHYMQSEPLCFLKIFGWRFKEEGSLYPAFAHF